MIDNCQLDQITVEAAKLTGFESEISAEFKHTGRCSVRWTRSYRYIAFEVSDVFSYATEEILRDIMCMTMEAILGGDKEKYRTEAVKQFCEANSGKLWKAAEVDA